MDGKTTIKYLQYYIRNKDHNTEAKMDYFLKLIEEVGELSSAIYEKKKAEDYDHIKGTMDEEIWDVIYYTLAIANLYDIDVEEVIKAKEKLNQIKYPSQIKFEENR